MLSFIIGIVLFVVFICKRKQARDNEIIYYTGPAYAQEEIPAQVLDYEEGSDNHEGEFTMNFSAA